MPNRTGKWKGGRIALSARGDPVYHLERMVRGRRYSIVLDVASEREAEAELALFVRDPGAYETRGSAIAKAAAEQAQEAGDRLVIDAAWVAKFLKHLQAKGRDRNYVHDTRRYLGDWAARLGDKDLRRLQLLDLKAALGKMPSAQPHRIAALKSFCSFLRDEGALRSAEDATIDLKIPQSTPEKNVRPKGYAMDHVAKVYAAIDNALIRDVVLVRAKTGLHGSELRRLAGGEGRLKKFDGGGAIAGILTVTHKNQSKHHQSLDAESFGALARILSAGRLPLPKQINAALDKAAQKAEVEPIRLGELRHSFVTWAKTFGSVVKPAEGGVRLEEIAEAIGHKDARTTKRFYDGTEVPPLIVVPLKLVYRAAA